MHAQAQRPPWTLGKWFRCLTAASGGIQRLLKSGALQPPEGLDKDELLDWVNRAIGAKTTAIKVVYSTGGGWTNDQRIWVARDEANTPPPCQSGPNRGLYQLLPNAKICPSTGKVSVLDAPRRVRPDIAEEALASIQHKIRSGEETVVVKRDRGVDFQARMENFLATMDVKQLCFRPTAKCDHPKPGLTDTKAPPPLAPLASASTGAPASSRGQAGAPSRGDSLSGARYEVERVWEVRDGADGGAEYLIEWRGMPDNLTWEPAANVEGTPVVQEFIRRTAATSTGGEAASVGGTGEVVSGERAGAKRKAPAPAQHVSNRAEQLLVGKGGHYDPAHGTTYFVPRGAAAGFSAALTARPELAGHGRSAATGARVAPASAQPSTAVGEAPPVLQAEAARSGQGMEEAALPALTQEQRIVLFVLSDQFAKGHYEGVPREDLFGTLKHRMWVEMRKDLVLEDYNSVLAWLEQDNRVFLDKDGVIWVCS